jgi:myo-inositol 2-dehydrogenase/D-chiro-inositol 1-dehydrogenase
MRFALLGNHPDGVDFTQALVDSGRHRVVACTADPSAAALERWQARRVADVEEVLADPAVEAVIVAGPPSVRPAQLRRALQSERHVACVHPADQAPEAAYEAAMIQHDTGYVLFPLLPEALHPGVARLRELVGEARSPVGAFRLLEVERASPGEVLENTEVEGHQPSFPGWDVVRAVGGEVAEVSALAEREEVGPGEPVLLAGRFEAGGLFQAALLPNRPAPRWRLAVVGSIGRAELLFPHGWDGPAWLEWPAADGELREEYFERWDPWPALVEAFEAAVERRREQGGPVWQDTVRALELDDAARRSVGRRRTSALEYPEASEEVGFKGTMTLAGCGLLWAVLLLLIVSRWVPWLGWVILPLLVLFAAMQLLRYAIPRDKDKDANR